MQAQLNESSESEVERLKSIMEEGKELVSKRLNISQWNIIKKSCYQKKLVGLDKKIISFNNKHIELHMFMEVNYLRLQVSQLSPMSRQSHRCGPRRYRAESRTEWTWKKKATAQNNHQDDDDQIQNHNRWKSEAQQHIYTSKLYQELAKLKLGGGDDAPSRGKAVHKAADKVLALTADGTTRWSWAILAGSLKLRDHNKRRVAKRLIVFRLQLVAKQRRKQTILAKLVPGCRKQPLPVILEETIDYIAALGMQVRAMTALANLPPPSLFVLRIDFETFLPKTKNKRM
ncbi:hypothetical protein K1719_036877 [Acacia pycnantha]|nr:hypothetical protein K1719_036877 [Acacia pycnantha]